MVTIRLARFGRKKGPFYRVVVLDSRKKTNGGNIDVLGFWNPAKNEFKNDNSKVKEWVKNGAQISPAVSKLISK